VTRCMRYQLRPATDNDYDFFCRLQIAAMKEYVIQTYGWDDAVQERYLRRKFARREHQIIVVDGHDVGVLEVNRTEDAMVLVNIQIMPEYQRRGLGTAVIRDVLADASRQGLPSALWVMKVNPARELYERLGFEIVEETDTHYKMEAANGRH
jgi:ribosomal protein S18 acetylase RimI-like enzyme